MGARVWLHHWSKGPAVDLDISFPVAELLSPEELRRSSGRAMRSTEVEIDRKLTQEDMILLDLEKGVKSSPIKKLRDSHHLLARYCAEGKGGNEISSLTGYSPSRISILRSDPAFQELIAYYKKFVEETRDTAFASAQAKLAAVNIDALDELHDRILDAPETFNHDQLLDVVVKTSDRTGNGPQSKSTNVNVNVDLAARIAAGRNRVAKLVEGSIPTLASGEAAGPAPAAPASPKASP